MYNNIYVSKKFKTSYNSERGARALCDTITQLIVMYLCLYENIFLILDMRPKLYLLQ